MSAAPMRKLCALYMAVLHPANCKDNFNFCEKNDLEPGVPFKKQKSGPAKFPLNLQ